MTIDLLFNSLLIESSLQLAAVFLVIGTYLYFLDTLLKRRKQQKSRRRSDFFITLDSSIELGTVSSAEDILTLYKGAHRIGLEEKSIEGGLIQELEYYMVAIHDVHEDNEEFVKKATTFIRKILKELKTSSPFSELPEGERIILNDIINYNKSSNTKMLTEKVHDLAKMLKIRMDYVDTLEASNRKQLILTVIGVVLTLLFGAISVIQILIP